MRGEEVLGLLVLLARPLLEEVAEAELEQGALREPLLVHVLLGLAIHPDHTVDQGFLRAMRRGGRREKETDSLLEDALLLDALGEPGRLVLVDEIEDAARGRGRGGLGGGGGGTRGLLLLPIRDEERGRGEAYEEYLAGTSASKYSPSDSDSSSGPLGSSLSSSSASSDSSWSLHSSSPSSGT